MWLGVLCCVSLCDKSHFVRCLIVVSMSPGKPPFAVQLNDKKIPWTESASELYRPSDRRLSAK
jgi:hypothetical protein